MPGLDILVDGARNGFTSQDAVRNILSIATTAVRATFHLIFPDNVEVYLLILEVVNYKNERVSSFVFPVLPSSMTYASHQVTKVTKLQSGIGVLKNSGFVPKRIALAGTFGPGFLSGVTSEDIQNLTGNRNAAKIKQARFVNDSQLSIKDRFNVQASGKDKFKFLGGQVFRRFNTGYGWTRALEKIGEDSQILDDGRPRTLLLFCPPLGKNYVVQWANFNTVMDANTSNRFQMYNLTLDVTADLNVISRESDAVNRYLRSLRLYTYYSLVQLTNQRALEAIGVKSIGVRV